MTVVSTDSELPVLNDELARLGVRFVRTGARPAASRPLTPYDLLMGLACSDEPRLRLSLIPLLLTRPDYAVHVPEAGRRLSVLPRVTLISYYTATRLLQRKYRLQLAELGYSPEPLPDLYSQELRLPVDRPADEQLRHLAERQASLSGRHLNWHGTYEHAMRHLLRLAEQEAAWATS